MERDWRDARDGKVWRVEGIPRMQTLQPGQPVAMMNKVPWRVSFQADDATHDLHVEYDVGSRLRERSDRELQRLLDEARGTAIAT